MRIALVAFENEISWGLRNIAEFLRSKGFRVLLYFLERYANVPRGVPAVSMDMFLEDFAAGESDIVGISFMTPYLDCARELAEKVRDKKILVVAGGIHPTVHPEDCIPFSDYIIRGAGEDSMLALLECLKTGEGPERGVFHQEDDFWFTEDVTKFPYPRYGDVEDTVISSGKLERTREVPRRIGPVTRYQTFTSFGCPYRCTYCVNPLLQKFSSRHGVKFLRRRNFDDVIAELCHVRNRIDTVAFEDEDFLIDPYRVISFLKRYKEEIDLPFSCLTMPVSLKMENLEELAQHLKEAKCMNVTIGLQSASPRTAKLFRRSFNFNRLQEVAQAFARKGIVITYDVILANPFEDETDVFETVDTILKLPHPFIVNIFYLTFFPGYLITEEAKSRGIDVASSRDTRTNLGKIYFEERVVRLAQVPFVPRTLLRFLYNHKSARWSRMLAIVLDKIITPIWINRWRFVLHVGLTHPKLIFPFFKKYLKSFCYANRAYNP